MNYYFLLVLSLFLKDEWIARLFHRSWRVKSVNHIL